MNNIEILQKIKNSFGNRIRPLKISRHTGHDCNDFECTSIEKQFGQLDVNDMSDYDARMMIIDNVLICDEAILYFLPKLYTSVLSGEGDPYLFLQQVKKIDKTTLNRLETDVLEKLEIHLNSLIQGLGQVSE